MSAGLLPCPWVDCGSPHVALEYHVGFSGGRWYVDCRSCSAGGPRKRSPDSAREAWNRRTPAAPPEAADLAITVRWTLGAWVWSVASDPPQSGESSSPSFAFDTALYCRNVIADGRNRDAAAAPGPAPASR